MIVEGKIKKIMVEILEVSESEIKEDTAIGDLANWDSLSHLRIISSIEREFNIQFTPDVLMDLEDFGDIVKATEDRIK
jgi:acyl carrier protein